MAQLIWIGIDPGDVTGVVVWDGNRWQGWEISGPLVPGQLLGVIEKHGAENIRIGCEQFIERGNQRKTNQPLAQRITGAIQAMHPRVRLISPSTAKRMCSAQRLKDLGWHKQTKDGHINDAGRVLFALIALTSPKELARLIPST